MSQPQPEQTSSRAFSLELASRNPKQIRQIKRGIRDWTVFCPKCKHDYQGDFGYMTHHGSMNTRDLENFDQASKRAAQMEADYEQTCPKHYSPWEATNETQLKHRETLELEDQ
jgi:hypothetical protein